MQLTDRFLNLVHQQLSSFEAESDINRLVVYVTKTREGKSPSLEAIDQWPRSRQALPPVEADPDLRAPSPDRRWYPIQDGAILLGVLRAERLLSSANWSEPIDRRLQATATALSHGLSLELEHAKLLGELNQQREQIHLMVHQLRNPLSALRTYAQLLLKRLGPESGHRNLVEGLLGEQAQLDRYISALDQIGQIHLPAQAASSAPLLLPPVLPEATDVSVRGLLQPLVERAATTANLQGRPWHAPSQWPSWTEQLRPSGDGVIAEVVANLLENAFRYSTSCTPIGLLLQPHSICIWDGGEPIANEDRDKIFERGIRGQSSRERPGSGLGLALGRQLAEQLGGSLELIDSPARLDPNLPKQGNAFVLNLPCITTPSATT